LRKIRRVSLYYIHMRRGLGTLHSSSIQYEETDLAEDKSSTLLKCRAEAEALGARHVCELRTTKVGLGPYCIYSIGEATVVLGPLRETEILKFFPAQQVIYIWTRFKDGRRHSTMNRPIYRGVSPHNVSARCLINDEGVEDIVVAHRRRVNGLITAGAEPAPPADNATEAIELLQLENEESRQLWQKSPYGWGDALHEACGICRQKYLTD